MTFPTINTRGNNVELTPELTALLEQKLAPLGKFLPAGETDVSCNVELEKVAEHQSGKIHRAEINLRVAGTLYRAEATEEQMERAIDVMRDEVKRELRRDTTKQQSLLRRGGQKIKALLRFGNE
ncbi:MAG: ribosome-associated translation inhibitor RaiA [Candidatus Pacebacteria bacterium]|nr:ribosome-associated translation inhibitor RaiA [Candidatus Paceibacterota bacterium]